MKTSPRRFGTYRLRSPISTSAWSPPGARLITSRFAHPPQASPSASTRIRSGARSSRAIILEIVPSPQRLVVEAQVQPNDIDNVAVGMDTDVRLTAFKQRTTPTLSGHLIYVSADRLTDNRSGQAYYLARAEIPESELARIWPLALQPGMPADAVIKKRERTALNHLIQPIADAMVRAWRED